MGMSSCRQGKGAKAIMEAHGLAEAPAQAFTSGGAPRGRLERRGWLAGTPPAFQEQILAMGRVIRLARGQRLYAFGDAPGGIYGVLSGGVGMEGCTHRHPLRLGHVVREGGWFGHGPALHGGQRTLGCRALEDSELLGLPLAALTTLMRENAEAARHIGTLATRNSDLLIHMTCDLLISDAARRTAAVLLRVTGAQEGVQPSHVDGWLLTQSELGEMANVSRHHINRILCQFADRGWLAKRYNRLRLTDAEALSGFAYGED